MQCLKIPELEWIPVPFHGNHLNQYELGDYAALVIAVGPQRPLIYGIETAPLPVLALPEIRPLDSLQFCLKIFDGVVTTRYSERQIADEALFFPLDGDSADQHKDHCLTGADLSGPTVWLAGHPPQKGIRWWGELMQPGFNYNLQNTGDDPIQPGMITLNLDDEALPILAAGGILLQPPEGNNPPQFFKAGEDYWRWEPGQLLPLLNSLTAQDRELPETAKLIRQKYLTWRSRQLKDSTARLVRMIARFDPESRSKNKSTRENEFALAHWHWLSKEPSLWERAGELLNHLNDNPKIIFFNRAIIGLRKWLCQPNSGNDRTPQSLARHFQSATADDNNLILIFYQSLFLASVQKWQEERELILSAFAKPFPPVVPGPDILLLPPFGVGAAVNYRKELWEGLGNCWEKLGYQGLAGVCFGQALNQEEDVGLRGRLGLCRLQAGEREMGMRDLSLACGRGCLIPEVWEKWLRGLRLSGELAMARRGAALGQFLFDLTGIPYKVYSDWD